MQGQRRGHGVTRRERVAGELRVHHVRLRAESREALARQVQHAGVLVHGDHAGIGPRAQDRVCECAGARAEVDDLRRVAVERGQRVRGGRQHLLVARDEGPNPRVVLVEADVQV